MPTVWSRLWRNAGYSILSLVAVALFGFAAMYFNARALGVEGLGVYATLIALTLMIEALAGMQLWQAVVALSEAREERVLGAAIAINLAAALIGTLIGFVALILLDFERGWPAFALIASQTLRMPDPFIGMLRKYDRFGYVALVRSAIAAATCTVAAVFWYLAAPLAAYLVAMALLLCINTLLLAAKCLQLCRPSLPSLSDIREVFAFSLPTGLSGAIGAVRQRGLLVLVGIFSGSGAAGLFAVADRIASVMQMAFRALFEAVFREMPEAERPMRMAWLLGGVGAIIGLVAALAAHWLGEPLIELVAGSGFRSAAPALTLLVAAVSLSIATLGFRALIIARIGPGAMLGCNLFALLALLAAPYLIVEHGVVGAAVTQIVFEGLWIIAVSFVLWRSSFRLRGNFTDN